MRLIIALKFGCYGLLILQMVQGAVVPLRDLTLTQMEFTLASTIKYVTGGKYLSSDVDEADTSIESTGSSVPPLENGNKNRFAPVLRDRLLFQHYCDEVL